MFIKQTKGFHVHFLDGRVKLPKWSVYAILLATEKQGKAYVWIEDIRPARNGQPFVLSMIRLPDERVRRHTVTAASDSIARQFATYIMALPADCIQKPVSVITHKDALAVGAPKSRTTPEYDRRARPDYSRTMIETFVTHNCKVGKRRYTEEAYWSEVMKCK